MGCSEKTPLVFFLTHMHPVQKFLIYLFQISFNIVLPSTPRFSKSPLLFVICAVVFNLFNCEAPHYAVSSTFLLPSAPSCHKFRPAHLQNTLSSCLNAKYNFLPITLFITYWFLWPDDMMFVSFIWRQKVVVTLYRMSRNGAIYYSPYCNKTWRHVVW